MYQIQAYKCNPHLSVNPSVLQQLLAQIPAQWPPQDEMLSSWCQLKGKDWLSRAWLGWSCLCPCTSHWQVTVCDSARLEKCAHPSPRVGATRCWAGTLQGSAEKIGVPLSLKKVKCMLGSFSHLGPPLVLALGKGCALLSLLTSASAVPREAVAVTVFCSALLLEPWRLGKAAGAASYALQGKGKLPGHLKVFLDLTPEASIATRLPAPPWWRASSGC